MLTDRELTHSDMTHNYIPARLVKGAHTWYIVYYAYDPLTGKKERFRVTNDLNRIRNRQQRLDMARRMVADINAKLPHGYPYNERKQSIDLIEGIKTVCALKSQGVRPDSVKSFRSISGIFCQYLIDQGIKCEAAAFSQVDAINFLNELRSKGLRERTVNNYITILSLFWSDFESKGVVPSNPWKSIRKKKSEAKTRRIFSPDEARVFLQYIRHNERLYLAVLLIYQCFIRPNELRFIQRQHIDLHSGTIIIPGVNAKNKTTATVTIPAKLIPILSELIGNKQPHNYILSDNNRVIGNNTIAVNHRAALREVKEKGIIRNTSGLELYSWKDTGVTEMAKAGIPVVEIMKQLRHHDLSMTQIYIDSLYSKSDRIRNYEPGSF